ncbi:hypothetical protein D1007_05370 [Hordeum vulgare]|nr:hypothetical protein D1007_05370 [Hordeum vulgare]
MEQPTPKRHNQTKDSSLPEELLEEIFARLPAKSARRLRCLSRSWSATLSSSSFADLHLERANQREGPPKLLFTTAQYRFHAWRHGAGSVAAERLTAGVLPLPRLEPARAVEVLTVKPCHGLVLLRRKYFRGHYLCNPCTGQLSLLPDSDMPSKIMFGPRRRHINNSLVAYGLGYSSKAKQHKVVRLISLHDEGTASCDVLPLDGVSVHWRPAAHQPAASCNTYHASIAWPVAAVFFNGHLHFLQHHHQGQVVITTFDVSDESFSSLPAPPGLENVPFGLAVLDGCLCAYYNGLPLNGDDPFYISRLVRATGQWEQLCCIQRQAWPALLPPSRWVYPLEIYHDDGHNKKIMFAAGVSTVFVVDLDSKAADPEIVFSPVMLGSDVDDAIMESDSHHTVGLLEESLVSPGRTNEEMIFSSPWRKAWSDVLKWLPARSVASLSHVCKDWHALIKSDRFVQLHAQLHDADRKLEVVLLEPYLGTFFPLEPMDKHQQPPSNRRVVCSTKPVHGLVVGSCIDGKGSSWDFICNPRVGYYKSISQEYDEEDESFFPGRIGLGYDARTKKHVPVLLVYRERNFATRTYQLECFVQLIDTSCLWTLISTPPRPVADMQPAYARGKLYWMVDPDICTELSGGRCEVLALDVSTKEFQVLQGPRCNYERVTSIVELLGNICVVCSDNRTNAIDIWTLEEGVDWFLGHRIELGDECSSDEATPLALDPQGDWIFLNTGKELGYYYPRTRTLTTICPIGQRLYGLEVIPVLSKESLIRPFKNRP